MGIYTILGLSGSGRKGNTCFFLYLLKGKILGRDTGQQKKSGNSGKAGRIAGPIRSALYVAGVYFIIGSVWVFFSDQAMVALMKDTDIIHAVSMTKGILYVVVTAIVLFIMVRRALCGAADYSRKLDDSYVRLQENYALLNASRDKLAGSEQQYRLLFNTMLSGYCVHELICDETGAPEGIHTLHTNPAYDQMVRLSPGEQPEEAFLRLLPGERRTLLSNFNEVVCTGKTMRLELYSQSVNKYLEFTIFQPVPGQFAAIINDISDRKKMEEALYVETEQLRVTLNSIGEGVVTVDTQGKITMLNGVAEQLTGMYHDQAVGLQIDRLLELCGGVSGARFISDIDAMLNQNSAAVFRGELQIKAKNGESKLLSCSATPMLGNDGGVLGYVAVFRDVTEQDKKETEILFLSYHDMLTGLYNRTFFEEELKRLDTERQLPLSIIMGDANNLKLVNDVFGHKEGDEMLRALAQVLRDSCRTEDIVSRWGGDEFTILLPQTDHENALMICRRITEKCREYHTIDKNLSPSISLGFETKASSDIDVNHVIKAAEDKMYKNKLLESRAAHNEFLNAMRQRISEIDLESEEHTGRLTEMCERTGREMNLQDNELADLRILSLLHDIGQAAIDSRILSKPSSLTDEEWEEIKRHSGIGYRIARATPELVLVADYILGHHERWDGRGYPQGLKGLNIPLPARIFAVVDAFDSMTQGRPYRQAMNQETALFELYRNAGTQFDPEVVNAFVSVLNRLTD